MDKKIIKGLIDEKLETIQEQFSIIKEYEGKIPNIEIDLLMTNIRDLYELFLALELENRGLAHELPRTESKPVPVAVPPPPVADPEPIMEKVVEEAPGPEPVAEEPPVEVAVSEPVAAEPVIETPPDRVPPRRSPSILGFEPVKEEGKEIGGQPSAASPPGPLSDTERGNRGPGGEEGDAEPETRNPEPETRNPEPEYRDPEPDPSTTRHPKITFDLFSDGAGNTLADRLRNTQEKRVADRLQEGTAVDLRTSIGINDKFLFINEMFDGNMRIYDEAVEKFGHSSTLAQADLLLLDLKIAYNWDSESPTVKKFVELVRRKFH